MAITVSAYAILDQIASIKSKPERVEALRTELTKNRPLSTFIQYVYHPDVVLDLPEGEPPYRANSILDDYAAIYRTLKKLHNFGVNSPVPRKKKELNWQALLETVSPVDVPLLNAIKDKKLPWRTLNRKFVVAAVPELYPDDTIKEAALFVDDE